MTGILDDNTSIFSAIWIVVIILAVLIGVPTALTLITQPVLNNPYIQHNIQPHPYDYHYMQHYVKLHVVPESEGVAISAWASDSFPPTSGVTDSNSDVVFEMISSVKYTIWIPERNKTVYIYPIDSEYIIYTGGE